MRGVPSSASCGPSRKRGPLKRDLMDALSGAGIDVKERLTPRRTS